MSLVLSPEAAAFLLRQIAKDPMKMLQPLRLSVNRSFGCGDVGHIFTFGAARREGDVLVESGGLTIICNIDDNEEFEYATITLKKTGTGSLASEKVLVIPSGAQICGCGESVTMPKK